MPIEGMSIKVDGGGERSGAVESKFAAVAREDLMKSEHPELWRIGQEIKELMVPEQSEGETARQRDLEFKYSLLKNWVALRRVVGKGERKMGKMMKASEEEVGKVVNIVSGNMKEFWNGLQVNREIAQAENAQQWTNKMYEYQNLILKATSGGELTDDEKNRKVQLEIEFKAKEARDFFGRVVDSAVDKLDEMTNAVVATVEKYPSKIYKLAAMQLVVTSLAAACAAPDQGTTDVIDATDTSPHNTFIIPTVTPIAGEEENVDTSLLSPKKTQEVSGIPAQQVCSWLENDTKPAVAAPVVVNQEQIDHRKALEAMGINPEDVVSLGEKANGNQVEMVIIMDNSFTDPNDINFRGKYVGNALTNFYKKLGINVHFSYLTKPVDIDVSQPYNDRRASVTDIEQTNIILKKLQKINPKVVATLVVVNDPRMFGGASADLTTAVISVNPYMLSSAAHETLHLFKVGDRYFYVGEDIAPVQWSWGTGPITSTAVIDAEMKDLVKDLKLKPEEVAGVMCGDNQVYILGGAEELDDENLMKNLPADVDVDWNGTSVTVKGKLRPNDLVTGSQVAGANMRIEQFLKK